MHIQRDWNGDDEAERCCWRLALAGGLSGGVPFALGHISLDHSLIPLLKAATPHRLPSPDSVCRRTPALALLLF